MAILRVAQMGHPVLRQVAEAVDPKAIRTSVFQQFCDDLVDTMHEYDGVGLAAPQVHESVRVVVAEIVEDEEPVVLVNPVITVLGSGTRRTWEGCLSVEGMRGLVERPDHIRLQAYGRDGKRIDRELHGFRAVVVQHECDHLDGFLYVDRVLPQTLMFLREWRRWHQDIDDHADVDDEGGED